MSENSQFDLSIAHTAVSSLLGDESLSVSRHVDFTGGDVCFDSPFYSGEAASAVIAAKGVIAAEINHLQGKQVIDQLGVDTRLAEASLVSFALQDFADDQKAPDKRPNPEDRTPASGFFKCKDGRLIYLHSSFPNYAQHSDAMLKLLSAAPNHKAIAEAISKIPAQDLEDKIAAAGLCGAMLRNHDEWDQSIAGQALSATPVIEVIKMTDTDPQQSSTLSAQSVLAGLKVLDLTRVLAGPTCAKSLSSFGAEVLHIRGKDLPYVESFVTDTGIGKRSAYLNLKAEKDRDVLQSLVKQSDVFSQGYQSAVMEKFGFSVEDVMVMNPDSIYVSINCYGHEGEWRTRPGWEQLAQVATGMAVQQGDYLSDGKGFSKPVLQPSALNDYVTGYLAALGVMLAKRQQLLFGGGYCVRVSLCRTAMWVRALGIRDYSVHSRVPDSAELCSFYQSFETDWGRLSALRPALSLAGKPLLWTGPPVPLGSHSASF
ncbi:MAG: CoA transferase [Pseudomonadales bacterium]|nr:CoA transferase [Pseudomonadales bacterium]